MRFGSPQNRSRFPKQRLAKGRQVKVGISSTDRFPPTTRSAGKPASPQRRRSRSPSTRTLDILAGDADDLRWVAVGIIWSFLFYGSLRARLSTGLLPLASLAIFLPLWKGRPLLAGGLAALLGMGGSALALARHGLTWRLFGTAFSADPLGWDFASSRVRHVIVESGWFGPQSLPHIPMSPTHYALGILAAHGGWTGLALWFLSLAAVLAFAFRIAWRQRGSVAGDGLASLTFLLGALSLSSVAHAVGLGRLGVTLPLLGISPGLTLLTLFTVGLAANLAAHPPEPLPLPFKSAFTSDPVGPVEENPGALKL